MFKRRLCTPQKPTPALNGCPDVWELEGGDVAIIGIRKTDLLKSLLPFDAKCGLDEEIVVVPKSIIASLIEMSKHEPR